MITNQITNSLSNLITYKKPNIKEVGIDKNKAMVFIYRMLYKNLERNNIKRSIPITLIKKNDWEIKVNISKGKVRKESLVNVVDLRWTTTTK